VLDDWDDNSAVRILKNCRRAMGDSGKIVVLESLLPAFSEVSFESLLDLNIMNSKIARDHMEQCVYCGAATKLYLERRSYLPTNALRILKLAADRHFRNGLSNPGLPASQSLQG
jgi:hypothetical protein